MDVRAIGAGITTVLGAARISEPERTPSQTAPNHLSSKTSQHKKKDIVGWNGDGLQLAGAYQELRQKALARHFIHLRWDPNFEPVDDILEQLQHVDSIGNLVYNDATPGERQFQNMEEQIKSYAFHRKVSHEEARAHYMRLLERGKSINNRGQGQAMMVERIPLGSHDDVTAEHVLEAHFYGATLTEMPVTIHAAHKARELGMAVCMEAPNYFRGGSHCGNLSSLEAINEGLVDMFCSDFHFPAMLGAAMKMMALGRPPSDVFRLFTLNPARHLRMDHEIGSIEVGKSADLAAFFSHEDYGLVTHVWVAGELRYQISTR